MFFSPDASDDDRPTKQRLAALQRLRCRVSPVSRGAR
jgi:hypothetical protein